jgi:hypothetical protein
VTPTYLGTITINASDATIIDQEHESPDKPASFEAPPGAEP